MRGSGSGYSGDKISARDPRSMYSITIYSLIIKGKSDVDSLAPSEAFEERNDAGMMALALQLDFVLNVVVVLLRTHLDRDLLPRAALRGFVARCTDQIWSTRR